MTIELLMLIKRFINNDNYIYVLDHELNVYYDLRQVSANGC